jgi:hypothetical protein
MTLRRNAGRSLRDSRTTQRDLLRGLVALAAVLMCAGCGGALERAQASCAVPSWATSFGGGGLVTRLSSSARPTAHIRAFARSRDIADAIPRSQRDSLMHQARAEESRLLAPSTNGHGAIYAIPSSNPTQLCIYEAAAGIGGCSTGFPEGQTYVTRSKPPCGEPLFEVLGIVPDGVTRVGLFINRQLHRVPVRNNVFLYKALASRSQRVNAFVLRYRDHMVSVTALGVGWKPTKAAVATT